MGHFMGNGRSFSFWKDNWKGDGALKGKCEGLFHLDSDANFSIYDRMQGGTWTWSWNRLDIGARNLDLVNKLIAGIGGLELSNSADQWIWLDNDECIYSVSDTRAHIDEVMLPTATTYTRWVKISPRKINVFLWRVVSDRLPTRLNLSRICIDIQEIGCAICNNGIESIHHVLFECNVACDLWRRVRIWVDCNLPIFTEWSDWVCWFEVWLACSEMKARLYVIVASLVWHIWSLIFRADRVFTTPSLASPTRRLACGFIQMVLPMAMVSSLLYGISAPPSHCLIHQRFAIADVLSGGVGYGFLMNIRLSFFFFTGESGFLYPFGFSGDIDSLPGDVQIGATDLQPRQLMYINYVYLG
ncbi:uncharacterized protein [Rutidosis leptorrhynchoides]|uniref:uncharacterized protein n=1 Tax=Rutidosis leptorrhynchoides TaxID=125765 RepID=UPI003A997E6D